MSTKKDTSEKVTQSTEKEPVVTRKKARKFLRILDNELDFKAVNFFLKTLGAVALFILVLSAVKLTGDILLTPLKNLISVLTPFILGIAFAWLLNPVVSAIDTKNRKKTRKRAAMIVTLSAFLVTFLVIFGIIIVSINTTLNFVTGGTDLADLSDSDKNIYELIEENINKEDAPELVKYMTIGADQLNLVIETKIDHDNDDTTEMIEWYSLNKDVVKISQSQIIDIASSFMKFFGTYVLTTMVVGFLLPGFRNMSSIFKGIIPKKYKEDGSELIDIVGKSFNDYMRGAIKIASILGGFIVLLLLVITILANTVFYESDYHGILIWSDSSIFQVIAIIVVFGLLASVTNLIPYVGPLIGGGVITILVMFTDASDGYWVTLSVLGSIVLVQSLESLFLQPIIMGRETKLHPVIILMSLAISASIFGIVGLFIATPITSVIRSVIRYYDQQYEIF